MDKPKAITWHYACWGVLGLLAIAALLALLIDVMNQHFLQAQETSRRASSQGRPADVISQTKSAPAPSDALAPVNEQKTSVQ